MRSTATTLSALAIAVSIAGATTAQEEPTGRFEGEVSVNEVQLDVVVTDRSGNVILGLGPNDFIVEEDGSEVEVASSTFYSNMSFVESANMAERLGIDPADVPVDRYFVLFIHDQRTLLPSLVRKYMDVTRRVEDWIFKELLPNDWVAVVRYDAKLMVHTDFTTDNQVILQAVRDAARGKRPPDIWPSRLEEDATGPSLMAHLPQGKEMMRQTKRIYDGMSVLADALGKITGRKNLLFWSMGFGEGDEFGNWTPDVRYYDPMMQALNDNNVAVYSISIFESLSAQNSALGTSAAGGGIAPAGNAFEPALGAAIDIMGSSLSTIADDTGGRHFFNFIAFDKPLSQVLEENNGYYLLSYRTETPLGESGYRQVEVKAKNPEFQVKARQGYRFGA